MVRGTLIAIAGLVIAGLLGWGLMSIGARRLREAEQQKEPLRHAMSVLAGEAIAAADEAALAVANKNWGDAQKPLRRVDEVASGMQQAATPETQGKVERARAALKEAQDALGKQDESTQAKLDALASQLRALQSK